MKGKGSEIERSQELVLLKTHNSNILDVLFQNKKDVYLEPLRTRQRHRVLIGNISPPPFYNKKLLLTIYKILDTFAINMDASRYIYSNNIMNRLGFVTDRSEPLKELQIAMKPCP